MVTDDWRERTLMVTGPEGLEKLRRAHVLVLGLGGVGSVAAEMLCRAGIGRMTITDGDRVTNSNRNRQLPALCSTVGRLKTEVMAERLLDINPDLELQTTELYLKDEPMIELLSAAPFDYVVDAIDTLSPKTYLIVHAVRMGLRVVSSMGSGAKLDPEQVRVADISETYQCTLAYDLRKRLRRLGIEKGVKAVFSPEPIIKEAIQHYEGERNKKSRIGTVSYMPAVFGCMCASVVIREILEDCEARE